jgi:hypothetical protein
MPSVHSSPHAYGVRESASIALFHGRDAVGARSRHKSEQAHAISGLYHERTIIMTKATEHT